MRLHYAEAMTVLFDTAAHAPPPPLPAAFRLGPFELQGAEPAATRNADSMLYRAWDHALARPVAVTEYLPAALARRAADGSVGPQSAGVAAAFAEGLERFIAQSRVLAEIEHPSLLRVLHLLIHQGTAYQVSPWYRGQRLQALRTRMAVPPDEVALRALLDEGLGALQALHRVGRAHGAVHPDNILLLDNDRALLLAPSPEAMRFDASLQNTRAPRPLHSAGSAVATPWGDCQALAQVARYCITGLWPVDPGTAPAEPLQATIDRLFFDIPGVHYAPDLLKVLDRAAAADADRRPQSAAEFRVWLDQPPPDVARAFASARPRVAAAAAARPAAAAPAIPPSKRPSPPADAALAAIPVPAGPAASEAAPPADSGDDEATARAIRQLVDSIPALPSSRPNTDPPRFAGTPEASDGRAANEAASLPPWAADRADRSWIAPVPKARRRTAGGLAALTLALLVGAAIWVAREPIKRSVDAWTNDVPATSEALAGTAPAAATASGVEAAEPALTSGPPTSAGNPQVAAAAAQEPAPEALAAPATTDDGPTQTQQNTQAFAPASASAALPVPETPLQAPDSEAPLAGASEAPRVAPGSPARSTEEPVAAARAEPVPAAVSPRQQCGSRTEFALYRCMQQECASARWRNHPQCLRLRRTDQVD